MITAPGRVREATITAVRFAASPNLRRRDLTWAEVTVLEAVRRSDSCEPSENYQLCGASSDPGWAASAWREALDGLRGGAVLHSLGNGAVLRGPALLAAAGGERRPPEWFAPRLEEVADIIGGRLAHPDPRPAMRFAAPPAAGDPFARP